MEKFTTFTSSRGLLKICNSHNCAPISSKVEIDSAIIDRHFAGASIYVCTDALELFVNEFLPKINDSFVLVTGDSDTPININVSENSFIHQLLNSPKLISWYAQNLHSEHPKLKFLPIGLDYHTMVNNPSGWGLNSQSPIAQERALMNVLAGSKKFSERYLAGYCNWHFAIDRGDRRECMSLIDKSICFIEQHPTPRLTTWQRQAECMFVVSPEGAGADCHRTWEAILLGCIPVLKRSSHSTTFDELPVLILDDWQQFNQDFLREKLIEFANNKYNYRKIFLKYWDVLINKSYEINAVNLSLNEFRELVTQNSY